MVDKKYVTLWLPNDLIKRLDVFKDKTIRTRSQVVELALIKLLEEAEKGGKTNA